MSQTTLDDAKGAPQRKPKMPISLPYIIGNEAAERFNFYGMKTVLTTFLVSHYFLASHGGDSVAAKAEANETTHLFLSLVYLTPVLGGLLADWFLGKYMTIMSLSLVYSIGSLVLALCFNDYNFFYAGLLLIALGSGGIKPCVSANVGDQFDSSNQELIPKAYSLFYMAINFGSTFSTFLTPWLMVKYGPMYAFGVPGILMLLATIIFFLGRDKFIKRMPNPATESKVVVYVSAVLALAAAYLIFDTYLHMSIFIVMCMWLVFVIAAALVLQKWWFAAPGNFIGINLYALMYGGFANAEAKYGAETIDGIKAVWRVLSLFAFIPFFWALYDQNGSEWVLQAESLNRNIFGFELQAEQVQIVNPILILALTPLLSFVIYPALEKAGIKATPLRKIGAGFIFTALSFIVIGFTQMQIDADPNAHPTVWLQILAYFLITIGEILISITGLEYAYTNAPKSMKSTIMSCWLLTVSVANAMVSAVNGAISYKDEFGISQRGVLGFMEGATYYWVFLGASIVITLIYFALSPRITEKSYVD